MSRPLYAPRFNFGLALTVSGFAHLVLLGVHFGVPTLPIFSKDPIEVVLVNSSSREAPKSDYKLAQANLDGGGNTDQDRSIKTPLPALEDSGDTLELEQTQARMQQLEHMQQQLLSRLQQGPLLQNEQAVRELAESTPESGEDLLDQSRQIARLEGQVSRQIDEYQKRPRKNFIGARTKSAVEAMYVDAFRAKVERTGELYYPTDLKRKKLYGSVHVLVSIRPDGQLDAVEIRKRSGSTLIDQAALAILTLAAPYPAFPPDLRKTTDILVISRYLSFTNTDRLETGAID